MTKEDREERMREIERAQFMLAMKDRWNSEDYKMDRELSEELKKLKEEQ